MRQERWRGGDLDGAEDLGGDQLEVVGLEDLGKGDKDSGGRDGAVLLGNGVALQPLPPKRHGGPRDLFQLLHMVQHGLCAPRQDGAYGLVLGVPACCLLGQLVQEACRGVTLLEEKTCWRWKRDGDVGRQQ